MSYARVQNEEIVEVGEPTRDPIFFNGQWYDCRTPEDRAAYIAAADWREVVETTKPLNTDTETFERTFQLIEGVPTEVWVARPWTSTELEQIAADAERNQINTDLRDGYTAIVSAMEAAQADAPRAESLRTQAVNLSGQITTQRNQAAAWVSQTTTTAARADLYAIRDQVVAMLDRQKIIVDNFAELLAYRKANDENVVVTARALTWLARWVSGRYQ